jgi:hypothetical protein
LKTYVEILEETNKDLLEKLHKVSIELEAVRKYKPQWSPSYYTGDDTKKDRPMTKLVREYRLRLHRYGCVWSTEENKWFIHDTEVGSPEYLFVHPTEESAMKALEEIIEKKLN